MTVTEKLLTFAHISDTHLHHDVTYTNKHIDYPALPAVRRLVAYLNAFDAPIDFVLHTGDVAHYLNAPEEYYAIREMLKDIAYPVRYMPGNHDHVLWFQSHFLQLEPHDITVTYDRNFEVNGVQFIMLDSTRPKEEETASGMVSDEQLAWLDALCSADDSRPLVVTTHHQVIPTQAPWVDNIRLINGDAVHEILLKAKHRLRGVFYGHIHESLVTVRDGISYYSAPSGWYQTQTYHAQEKPSLGFIPNNGFNLVTLTAKDTFVRVIRLPHE